PVPDVSPSPAMLYPGIPAVPGHSGGSRPPLAEVTRCAAHTAAVESPPAATPDAGATLDLGVALRLAGVDNPTINLAREAVREALAAQLAARALPLPNLNAGGNFRLHRGVYQTGPGTVRDVDVQSLYL